MKHLLLVLFWGLILTSYAQTSSRPKIAVVLSGGGAKGMAHVGFLKVMEEAGLKPDIIVGTSMGSIVGGLYALGFSASQLDSMCRAADWDRLLSNKTPLYDINFENKYFEDRLEFDGFPIVKGKLKLPNGIIQGQYLQEFFDSLVFEKKSYHDFLKFPIAYTAVACNIENGQAVYLDTGNFTKAIRASMAIPSVFAPVRINGAYHVDGGGVDNFPVQRAIEMGADIVIGVNVGGGFETGEDVNSAVGSLMQTAFIVSYSKLPKDMGNVNLYIEPNLHGYSTGSFGAADSIIYYGYQSALPYLDTLKILAQHSREEIPVLKDIDSYKISEITFKSIEPLGSEMEKFILAKLDVKVGDTIYKEKFFRGMEQLRSTQLLKNVFFALNKKSDGYELELQIIQKEKVTLGVSVNYNVYQSFGLVIGLTGRNAIMDADRLKLLGRISESPKIEFNYLKYIGKKRGVGVSANALYSFNQIPTFEDGNKTSVFNYHFFDGGLFFNTTKSSKQALAIGVDYMLNTATGSVVADTNLQKIKKSQAQFVFARLAYQLNTLNAREFPTHGVMLSAVFTQNLWNGVKVNPRDSEPSDSIFPQLEKDMQLTNGYQKIELEYSHYLKLSKSWSLILGAHVNAVFSRKVGAVDRDYIGGFMSVVPYQAVFWGVNFAKGGSVYNYASPQIGLRVEAFNNFYITAMFNYMTYLDTDQRFYWNTIFDEKLYTYNLYGGGIDFAYNTRVGPVRIGAGYGTGNKNVSLFVSAGFNL